MTKDRNIQIIKDLDGKNIVIINDIIFKGKKHINWKDVEAYLKKYVGEFYQIAKTKNIVYIGKDFPSEFARSKYSKNIARSTIKAKSNIIEAIPEIIEIATNKKHKNNTKDKHSNDAKYGWYKFDSRFAFPKFGDGKQITGYKVYKAILVIRKDNDGRMFLYDVMKIFKEK